VSWRSTTFRFAALVFALQIVAAAVLLAGLGATLRSQSSANAEMTAEAIREDLLATYAGGGAPALAQAIELRKTRSITRDAVMLLTDAGGRTIAGNLGNWPPSLAFDDEYHDLALYRVGHVAPEAMLVRATRLPGGERFLSGIAVEGERQILGLLERTSIAVLAMAFIFAALAAWLAARLIVGRLETTITTLGVVRGGDLTRRVPEDGSGDAFATLAAEVNHTLDRIAALIGELKIATDGLAHDLKSPLTRMRAALERAAADATEPAAQNAVDRALGESERLMALVETALSVSRAEAGLSRDSFVMADLSEMLEAIAEIYAPLVEDHDRAIRIDAPERIMRPVHREFLGQAIGNLIDNALKYGDGTITLSLFGEADGGVRIAVADEGAGIPVARREQALRRFGRLDDARGGSGAGLGLSLVQAVAHLHDGTLELADAGPGLSVILHLPRIEA